MNAIGELNQAIQTGINSSEGVQQFLTFMLSDELYGVDILKVVEIRGLEKLTSIPKVSESIKGVINLRGQVIPVFDLRTHFGMPYMEYGATTVNIILNVAHHTGNSLTIGVIADSVSDVVDVSEDLIAPAPELGSKVDMSFIDGFSHHNEDMLILLNLDAMFHDTDYEKAIA